MYYEQKETGCVVPVSQAGAATAETGSLSEMPRLYRSTRDLEHWFVYEDAAGWSRFPAKVNGWTERRPVRTICGLELREVPLWLSFNTGLLESTRPRRAVRAA